MFRVMQCMSLAATGTLLQHTLEMISIRKANSVFSSRPDPPTPAALLCHFLMLSESGVKTFEIDCQVWLLWKLYQVGEHGAEPALVIEGPNVKIFCPPPPFNSDLIGSQTHLKLDKVFPWISSQFKTPLFSSGLLETFRVSIIKDCKTTSTSGNSLRPWTRSCFAVQFICSNWG